jgi:hypothetical protein
MQQKRYITSLIFSWGLAISSAALCAIGALSFVPPHFLPTDLMQGLTSLLLAGVYGNSVGCSVCAANAAVEFWMRDADKRHLWAALFCVIAFLAIGLTGTHLALIRMLGHSPAAWDQTCILITIAPAAIAKAVFAAVIEGRRELSRRDQQAAEQAQEQRLEAIRANDRTLGQRRAGALATAGLAAALVMGAAGAEAAQAAPTATHVTLSKASHSVKPRLSPQQKQMVRFLLMQGGASETAIAHRVGVSPSSVHRMSRPMRERAKLESTQSKSVV